TAVEMISDASAGLRSSADHGARSMDKFACAGSRKRQGIRIAAQRFARAWISSHPNTTRSQGWSKKSTAAAAEPATEFQGHKVTSAPVLRSADAMARWDASSGSITATRAVDRNAPDWVSGR